MLTLSRDHQGAELNVQIPHIQRVLFNKLAPALHIFAH